MTYFASLGEMLLILALIIAAKRCVRSTFPQLMKLAVVLSLGFVAVTASFGVFRFAGVESVIAIHDTTSWLSSNIAMTVYASVTALLFLKEQNTPLLTKTIKVLLVLNTVLCIVATTMFSNVLIFIALVLTAY